MIFSKDLDFREGGINIGFYLANIGTGFPEDNIIGKKTNFASTGDDPIQCLRQTRRKGEGSTLSLAGHLGSA
jgi:hypothetical protein